MLPVNPKNIPVLEEDHDFASLDRVRAELEAKFEELMQKCAEKVSELCALEKKTWQAVDSLSEKCSEMMSEVDLTAEKQVIFLVGIQSMIHF